MSGVHTVAYTVEWAPAGSFVDITASVLSVDGGSAAGGNGDTPLAFDSAADATLNVTVLDTLSGAWERTPIRYTVTIDGSPASAFVGLVTSRKRSSAGEMVLSCTGARAFSGPTKAYSPLVELRALFTKTTASSIEDPTNGSYVGGVGNYGLWQAGGRPYEQAGSYPSASFYYSCDQAIICPNYSWLAGEDGWAELQKLAEAACGQLYQDTLGVVRYRQPLNVVSGAASYTFDESVYGSLSEETATGETGGTWICSFTPRAARAVQQVTDDTTPRLIQTGEDCTIAIEPQWPLASLETDPTDDTQLLDSALVITDLSGHPETNGDGFTHTLDVEAQKVTIVITNTASKPLVCWRVVLKGSPITAGETGHISVGSGATERQISDSPYIQTKGDATKRAKLYQQFYGTSRAKRTLSDCPYDVSRTVGEIVNVSNTRLSISGAHVILGIDHADTGATANYTVAPCSDLPAGSDFWLVSTSAQTGVKKIGY